MTSSASLRRIPTIEARISKPLIEQLEQWVEAFSRTHGYSPDSSFNGEAALKTLATAYGMRKVVQHLRMVHESQNRNQQEKPANGRSDKQRRSRWRAAGASPPGRAHPGTERPPSGSTPTG